MAKEATLMQRYTDYNDRLKARGINLIAFNCPHCAESIETHPAPAGEVWDALSQCPHCERMYMKITEGKTARGDVPVLTGEPIKLRAAHGDAYQDEATSIVQGHYKKISSTQ